jgi:hypothetical protein
MSLHAVLADDEYAAAIYSVRTPDSEDLGVLIASVSGGKITRVWHYDPLIDKGTAVAAAPKGPPPPPTPKS